MNTARKSLARNGKFLTQREIAELFGLSAARVSVIEAEAIEKLRKAILQDPVIRTMAMEMHLIPSGEA